MVSSIITAINLNLVAITSLHDGLWDAKLVTASIDREYRLRGGPVVFYQAAALVQIVTDLV